MQLHWRTSWTNKPYAQTIDQENNCPKYSRNQTMPSIWGYNQRNLSFHNDASMKQLLETTWKQARNETFKVHEMKQLY
jgi:hypothetical protein